MKNLMLIIFLCGLLLFGITGCGNNKKGATLTCEEGYYAKDGVCRKIEDIQKSLVSYECPSGYELNEEKTECTLVETKEAKIDKPCESGYTYQNGVCTRTLEQEVTIVESCLYGTSNGSKCVDKTVKPASIEYHCDTSNNTASLNYVSSLGKCMAASKGYRNCLYEIDREGFVWADDNQQMCYYLPKEPIKSYHCKLGTLEGTNCVIITETEIVKTKKCPSGYTASGNKCVKTETKSVTGTYYCENGYTLNKTSCTKTTVGEVKKSYSCEDASYELIDNQCILFSQKDTNE